MKNNKNILIETKDRYAIITINRPDAMNALNTEILEELYETIENIVKNDSLRAIILTGSGEKSFVAGADIAAMKDMDESQAESFARAGHRTMNAISQAEIISLAAINGFALGGGLELALACDLRFASENAKLGLPEVSLGLIPGFGGTQRLPRIVGKAIALEMILGGNMIDANRAYQIGLLNAVHSSATLMEETEKFVQKLTTNNSFVAQKTARWAVQSGMDVPLSAGLAREIAFFGELFASEDPKIGMNAFLNKEKGKF